MSPGPQAWRRSGYPSGVPGANGEDGVRYFSLGRHALTAGLRALGIGHGHVVLLPEFICRDLLAAVHAVEARVLFYPVDEGLVPHSLPVGPTVKAVVSVNYFGFPQRLDVLRNYCAEHGAVLIEDNAHGFLSRDAQNMLLGTRGDLGLFSLHKTFFWPDGAVLLVNRPISGCRLPAILPCRRSRLPAKFLLKHVLGRIQHLTGFKIRSAGEKLARLVRAARTGQALPVSLDQSEFEIPDDPAIHCKSVQMLGKIDPAMEVARRRELYRDFHLELASFGVQAVFENLPEGTCPYGYPFRADDARAAVVAEFARRRGFDCSRWPDLPSAVFGRAPAFYQNVWWINFLC
jgi:hypothetical protein